MAFLLLYVAMYNTDCFSLRFHGISAVSITVPPFSDLLPLFELWIRTISDLPLSSGSQASTRPFCLHAPQGTNTRTPRGAGHRFHITREACSFVLPPHPSARRNGTHTREFFAPSIQLMLSKALPAARCRRACAVARLYARATGAPQGLSHQWADPGLAHLPVSRLCHLGAHRCLCE